MINKILYTVDFTPNEPPELKKWAFMIRKLYEQLARSYNNMVDVVNSGGAGAVSSVFGRSGVVVAVTNDYTQTQIAAGAVANGSTATTQTFGDNTTKIATDAFVQAAVAGVTSPVTSVFGRTGAVVAVTNDYTQSQIASGAIANGSTATTQAALDASTKVATDAYCDSAVGVEKTRALAAEALLAPLASPTFTGTPAAPTQTPGDNTTALATDAFVQAAVLASSGAPRTFFQTRIFSAMSTVLTCTTANHIGLQPVYISNPITISSISYTVSAADNTAHSYDFGLYGPGALNGATVSLALHIGTTPGTTFCPTIASHTLTVSGAPITIQPGWYAIALTGNTNNTIVLAGDNSVLYWKPFAGNSQLLSGGGASLPGTVTVPALSWGLTSELNLALW